MFITHAQAAGKAACKRKLLTAPNLLVIVDVINHAVMGGGRKDHKVCEVNISSK